MVVNLALLLCLSECALRVSKLAAPLSAASEKEMLYMMGSVVLGSFAACGYALVYFSVSLAVGERICGLCNWNAEFVFELVVLGIPTFLLFAGFFFFQALPEGGIASAFKLIYSCKDPFALAEAALLISFPFMALVKLCVMNIYLDRRKKDKVKASQYRHMNGFVKIMVHLAPGRESRSLSHALRRNRENASMREFYLNDKYPSRHAVIFIIIEALLLFAFWEFSIREGKIESAIKAGNFLHIEKSYYEMKEEKHPVREAD
jgi:hypothetical protein